MPTLRLDDPHDEAKLLERLRSFRARTRDRLTVLFDSGSSYSGGKTKKQGGITVQFAPSGKTADQLIIRRLQHVKNPQGVAVVSSDRAVQRAARQAGVRTIDAAEFAQQLHQSLGTVPDAGSQAEVNLSPDEVENWLNLFNQSDQNRT